MPTLATAVGGRCHFGPTRAERPMRPFCDAHAGWHGPGLLSFKRAGPDGAKAPTAHLQVRAFFLCLNTERTRRDTNP